MATLLTWAEEDTSSNRPGVGGTIAEIVLSEVTNLVSRKRPLMSSIGDVDVEGTFVEVLTDELETRAFNAVEEGIAFTAQDLTQPVRHFVHVQTFYKSGQISDIQQKVRHYNGDPMTYQVNKRLQAMLNDIEHSLHRGSALSGSSGTARQLAGLLNIFPNTTAPLTMSDYTGETLSEKQFVDLLEVFQANTLDVVPTQCYVNTKGKRTISEYSTKVTRNVNAAERIQQLIIERHTSDFGDVDVMLSHDQLNSADDVTSGTSVTFIDPAKFKKGWLTKPTVEELSRDGLRRRFQMHAQCTLVYMNDQAGGGGTNFIPAIGTA